MEAGPNPKDLLHVFACLCSPVRIEVPHRIMNREESLSWYWSGQVPSRSISLIQYLRVLPSRWVNLSSNRFISPCHLRSVTNGRGQIMRTDLISRRACNSRRMSPASIVLPTPTPSAISNLGRSDRMKRRNGPKLVGDKVDASRVE